MRVSKTSINKKLLISIVLLIPVNLAYHFYYKGAFINGVLSNFLQPTIYLQDILAFLYISLNLNKNKLSNAYLIWFIFTLFLSFLSSTYPLISLFYLLRTLLYVGFLAKVENLREDKNDLMRAFAISTILISILGILQWFHQGSVFDNYLFFGEQPYTAGTPGINLERFFGKTKVPPYGTFMHPNTFAGFLCIVLVWFYTNFNRDRLFKVASILGIVTLFLTLSKFTWFVFIFGILMATSNKKGVYTKIAVVVSVILLFLPIFGKKSENPSIYRRADLLNASYKLVLEKPLFGYGQGTAPLLIEKKYPSQKEIRLAEPPHNIFVLTAVESGLVALLLFLIFINRAFLLADDSKRTALMQIIILGSFDHYFLTMPQTQLLMWFCLLVL